MSQRSTFKLFQPLATGSAFIEDVTELFRDSWNREALALGGDFRAAARFTGSDATLERWLDQNLAGRVVENYGGLTAFEGLIWSITLVYNGLLIVKSLDTLFNKIAVYYSPSQGEPNTLTAFSSDADSVAAWGTRELLYRTTRYMSTSSAEALRDKLLAENKTPRAITAELAAWEPGQRGTVGIEVMGYSRTLDWQHLNVPITTAVTDDASDEIADALSGADFITAGAVSTNTIQIREELDYRPAWQRIKEIAQAGDSSGDLWLAGCYQGRTLDYFEPTVTTPTYYVDVRKQDRGVFYDAAGNEIPAALVLPGRVVFARDIMGGLPLTDPLLDDPRSLFIESLRYTAADNQIRLRGANQQQARLAGLELAAVQALQKHKIQAGSITTKKKGPGLALAGGRL